jgi:hypothetical protein
MSSDRPAWLDVAIPAWLGDARDCLDCLEPSGAGEMGGKVSCCISLELREAAGGENAIDMGNDVRSIDTDIASRSRQYRWMGSNGSSKSPDWTTTSRSHRYERD